MSPTRVIKVSISAKGRGLRHGFSFETGAIEEREALVFHKAMCDAVQFALGNGRPPMDFAEIWRDIDKTAAAAITSGLIDKAHALAVLHLVRDAVATRDPKLGDKLIATLCEAAEEPAT